MSISKKINQSDFRLIKDDLTALDVEAFVFYAQSNLALGSGFGNAISMRGGPSIKKELDELGSLDVGQAIASKAGELKAKYIIHAVGPGFQEENTETKLQTTIISALKCAEKQGIKQLAIPLMGVGFYGIPLPVCSKIMIKTIKDHLADNTTLSEVIICANDNREYRAFEKEFAS